MGVLDEIFADLVNPFGANEFLRQIQQAAFARRNKGLREFSGLRFREELEAELDRIRQAQEEALEELGVSSGSTSGGGTRVETSGGGSRDAGPRTPVSRPISGDLFTQATTNPIISGPGFSGGGRTGSLDAGGLSSGGTLVGLGTIGERASTPTLVLTPGRRQA